MNAIFNRTPLLLEEPFVIRETRRKFQHTIS